jgi:hypothetical protein
MSDPLFRDIPQIPTRHVRRELVRASQITPAKHLGIGQTENGEFVVVSLKTLEGETIGMYLTHTQAMQLSLDLGRLSVQAFDCQQLAAAAVRKAAGKADGEVQP